MSRRTENINFFKNLRKDRIISKKEFKEFKFLNKRGYTISVICDGLDDDRCYIFTVSKEIYKYLKHCKKK